MQDEVFHPCEIAAAAGVPLEQVIAAVGAREVYLPHQTAILLGRRLARLSSLSAAQLPLFAAIYGSPRSDRTLRIPLAAAAAAQAAIFGVLVIVSVGAVRIVGSATTVVTPSVEPARLVFIAGPGPGGGGGGGGRQDPAPASRALKRGPREVGNPVAATPPVDIEPTAMPPLESETFPVLVAPIAPIAANTIDRAGTVDSTQTDRESHGPGQNGGAGTGVGSGVGSGSGPGLGPGVGGGTGGGVYRPGSGVEAPRLLREVKPDYPDAARRQGIEGEVVLELVVRSDGMPSDIRIRRHLGPEFDARAIDAVRQWRFSPGRFRGTPVDVAVEVSVDFRLR
jgi:periplasmic protein TonB